MVEQNDPLGIPDLRNVADRFKGWTQDLIREDLNKRVHPFAVLMENWQGDFNLGTLVRNANVFAAKEVLYIGRKKYDRRGAVGAYHYTSVQHLVNMEELVRLKERYTFIGVDNVEGSVPVESFIWPENSLMIFGEEGCGLTLAMIKQCDTVVAITQYGSVRSLNAGTASGIVMYDYVKKMKS